MKQKLNFLIIAALFLIIMPIQFGCDKEDELQPQQTEEQATADEEGAPPLPEGVSLSNTNNLKSGTTFEIELFGGIASWKTPIHSWDVNCFHRVTIAGISPGDDVRVYHFYKRNSGSWISKRRDYVCDYNYFFDNAWNVSFRKDDNIQTYAYMYVNGSYIGGGYGNTYTIADPPEANNTFEEFVLDEAINFIVNGIFSGFGIPFSQVASWFSDGDLYDDGATVLVVDQDGNPLHAKVGFAFNYEANFLGNVFRDEREAVSTETVTCMEPNGPESYDNNLDGRSVSVNLGQYNNEAYWGVRDDEYIPVITVTFNTNGTTTVSYPETPVVCIDEAGQEYATVTIGTQTWMAENLNYNVSGSWSNSYGRLYDWDAAKVAAANVNGWHLPTDAEWTTLTTYLGSSAGGKMKETGIAHWNSPNTGATNESGFTGLPGGYRSSSGTFYDLGYTAYFWSATELNSSHAWCRGLDYLGSSVYRNDINKDFGYSVRLIKD